MVNERPIQSTFPSDLWQRIAALDAHCGLAVTRDGPAGERHWRVTIRSGGECLAFEADTLVEALWAAVIECESRGWPEGSAEPGRVRTRGGGPGESAGSDSHDEDRVDRGGRGGPEAGGGAGGDSTGALGR